MMAPSAQGIKNNAGLPLKASDVFRGKTVLPLILGKDGLGLTG